MPSANALPSWAPRVPQGKIRRLYENDALGIYDEELIADVGYGLLARCESFIDANNAVEGRACCPRCSMIVDHDGRKEALIRCQCGWELTWRDYFDTIHHRQLRGAEPVLAQFREFVAAYPSARTPPERVFLIDRLIHGFHWHFRTNAPTRPVAVNLIQGRLGQVVSFLESLSYSPESAPGTSENRVQWDANIEVNRQWYSAARPGQQTPCPEEA